jgi:hypothetical protein
MHDFLWGIVTGIVLTAMLSGAVVWFLAVISCEPEPRNKINLHSKLR